MENSSFVVYFATNIKKKKVFSVKSFLYFIYNDNYVLGQFDLP